ncbi:hypothetical protein J6590_052600 [Homalodisca vitripennis]|nr:hypothetical protein J6590_052599 [Homalodisca vitripennis]KAG8316389.1 hypothetical protein J6590_052600 [Homalodisca vitripennis]
MAELRWNAACLLVQCCQLPHTGRPPTVCSLLLQLDAAPLLPRDTRRMNGGSVQVVYSTVEVECRLPTCAMLPTTSHRSATDCL